MRRSVALPVFLVAAFGLQAQPNTPTYILTGATKDAKLGASVARVPDTTGDGVDELVSGNHRWDGPKGKDCGRVLLFNGATGSTLWTFNGEKAGGLLGHNVWGVGDIDRDGYGDVLASAFRFPTLKGPNQGKVYLLSGRNGGLLWSVQGEKPDNEFGYALGSLPDLDGDRRPEILVGAWINSQAGWYAGKAYVLSGRTGQVLRTHLGQQAGDRFGCAVAGFKDLDGDGYGDYAVGALYGGPKGEGAVAIYSGRRGTRIRTLVGERPSDVFGWAVAAVPDTDGDGVEEIFVGARDHDTNGTDAGRGYLFSGRTGKLLFTFDGERAWDKFGRWGAGVPDADGDGWGDVLIGAYWNNPGNITRAGAAYLFSGRTGRLLRKYAGEGKDNMFGYGLTALNDINGDGRGDVVVGAYQYLPNQTLTESYGRIYVYTDGLTSTPSTLSASRGGTVTLQLDLGPKGTRRLYLVVAGISGRHPGFDLPGPLHVPLNFDLFSIASWLYANSPILVNSYGTTDSRGRATCYFVPPPGFLGPYAGKKLTFVGAAVDRPDLVTNAVTVAVVP